MNKLIANIGVLLLFLTSCQQNQYDVTIKSVGTLSVTAENVSNGKVQIFNYHGDWYGESLLSEEMINGKFQSESIREGVYNLAVTAERNGYEYTDIKLVQVLSGKNSDVVLNPFNNTGNVKVEVIDSSTRLPIAGVNIGIMKQRDYWNTQPWETKADKVISMKQTDINGKIDFLEVPSHKNEHGKHVSFDNDFFVVVILNSQGTEVIDLRDVYIYHDLDIYETITLYNYSS